MANLFGRVTVRIFQNFKLIPTNILSLATSTAFLNQNQTRFGHAFPQFINLPKVNKIAGGGNTYQTKIIRKRIIKDPNEPNFKHIETLKWTNWRMLRDLRRRYIFRDYHFDRSCLINLCKTRQFPASIRETSFQKYKSLPRDSTFQHLRNRCALTGRSRGLVKKYRLSRLCWRNLADYNKLSGVIKACWR